MQEPIKITKVVPHSQLPNYNHHQCGIFYVFALLTILKSLLRLMLKTEEERKSERNGN